MLMFFLIWIALDIIGLIFLVLGCFIENHWNIKDVVKDFICDLGTILGFMILSPVFCVIGFTYFLVVLCKPLIDRVKCKFNKIKERILDWCESEDKNEDI